MPRLLGETKDLNIENAGKHTLKFNTLHLIVLYGTSLQYT